MKLVEINPINQRKLFNYDNLFLKIVNLHNQKKLPNKIIFSGSKGIGKSTFAYHLINFIFSKDEKFQYNLNNFEINNSNRSHNLILNNTHPNFYLIDLLDEKKVIEISQIREMINYANKSALNNKERIILIDNAEHLNLNSSSALLKIVEEPNDNIFFIFIFDNSKKILETLNSRCLKFNFFLTFKETINITNNIINDDVYNIFNKNLNNHYNTVGDFINLINFSLSLNYDLSKVNLKDFLTDAIDEKFYKKDFYIKQNIFKYIEFYFLSLIKMNTSKKNLSLLYENFIKKIYNLKKFNLDEESFFIDFKTNILNG